MRSGLSVPVSHALINSAGFVNVTDTQVRVVLSMTLRVLVLLKERKVHVLLPQKKANETCEDLSFEW